MSSGLDSIPDGSRLGSDRQSTGATLRGRVSSSFGSATDSAPARIDLNDALIRHHQATFVMRAAGVAMSGVGIDDGDVLLVDRAITPSHGHVVVAVVDGEMICRRLWRQGRKAKLQATHLQYLDITVTEVDELVIWGVVTTVIKQLQV